MRNESRKEIEGIKEKRGGKGEWETSGRKKRLKTIYKRDGMRKEWRKRRLDKELDMYKRKKENEKKKEEMRN